MSDKCMGHLKLRGESITPIMKCHLTACPSSWEFYFR